MTPNGPLRFILIRLEPAQLISDGYVLVSQHERVAKQAILMLFPK